MRVSASVRFTLKDYPKGYRGEIGATYVIGKDNPITFSNMVVAFMRAATDHYWGICDIDEMNAELDLLRDRLSHIRFIEEGEQS